MARTTLAEVRDPVNLLYYGDPGSGKTTALAHLANHGRVVHIDSESGLKAKPLQALGVNIDNIELHRDISYPALEELFWDMKSDLDSDPDAYAGVIWDSITETQKIMLESVVSRAVEKANNKGMERDEFFVAREDWGVITEQMRRLIRMFRDLPCHTGWSALERRDQDDDGTVKYGPALSPAVQTDLMGYVDLICHTESILVDNQDFFVGQFRGGGKYQVKDRLGPFPVRMVTPTFERIIAYYEGTLSEDNDPELERIRRAQSADRAEEAKAAKKEKDSGGTDKDAA